MFPDFPTGAVRKPPPLQSILRLQRTVGNRAAQRILAIGDGRPIEPETPPADTEIPAPSPEPQPKPRPRWRLIILAGGLTGALATAASIAAKVPTQPAEVIAASSALLAALLTWTVASPCR